MSRKCCYLRMTFVLLLKKGIDTSQPIFIRVTVLNIFEVMENECIFFCFKRYSPSFKYFCTLLSKSPRPFYTYCLFVPRLLLDFWLQTQRFCRMSFLYALYTCIIFPFVNDAKYLFQIKTVLFEEQAYFKSVSKTLV